MFELNPVEVRVLGSLIEKMMTTPDYYPMTMNALVNACNQKSNRHPLVEFDERSVLRALDSLREKKLAALIHQATSRVPKYEQRLGDLLELDEAELAIFCELLVRGPQTLGELRGRCSRLHPFDTVDEVREIVEALARRNEGQLLKQLPRQSGRKEPRYAQLLGGEPEIEDEEAAVPVEPARLVVQAEEERIAGLEATVAALRDEVAALRAEFATFKQQFE